MANITREEAVELLTGSDRVGFHVRLERILGDGDIRYFAYSYKKPVSSNSGLHSILTRKSKREKKL